MEIKLRTGEVAKLIGVSSSLLRKYEEAGRIPKAERSATGQRIYRLSDVERIKRVVAGKEY